MKFAMFAVYDSKAACFFPPFTVPNEGVALRAFAEQCNDTNSQFNRFPADFTLFHIGEYDTDTGDVTAHIPHENIGCASQFVRARPVVQVVGDDDEAKVAV